jgi:hypothetical protein
MRTLFINKSTYNGRPGAKSRGIALLAILICMSALILPACAGGGQPPTDPPAPTPDSEPAQSNAGEPSEQAEPASPEDLQALWSGSAHADTFVVTEDGTNSSCARCHAPVNWVPTMEDIPESCLTCKFEVAPPPPFVPQEDWTDVECMVCHRVNRGEVEPEYAWLEIAPIEEYASVADSTELCDKCHLAGDISGHTSVTIGGGHPDFTCTDCHDAHAITATCSNPSCHADVLSGEPALPGHDEDHAEVGCVACHDASGLAVDFVEDRGEWSTLVLSDGGVEPGTPFVSHDLAAAAPCERCHYPDNPWELSPEVVE